MATPKRYTTPAGIAKFPRLNKPETEINGTPTKPKFKCTVILDEDEVEQFKAPMQEVLDAAVAEAKKSLKKGKELVIADLPIRPHKIKEDDEEKIVEGKVEITAKTAAEFEDKKTKEKRKRVVPLFNAKGIPLTKRPQVGGGSKVRMAFTIGSYSRPVKTGVEVGVTLYLEAVKILDLVEFGGGDANSFGFGEEEDGYDGSDSMESDEPSAEESDDSESEGSAADY